MSRMALWRTLVRQQADGSYLFAHALIRDAVYDSLLRSRRRELHRRAGGWFEARDPVLHAEHLDRAEDPGAAGAYLVAARAQSAGYRYEAALRLVRRGFGACGRASPSSRSPCSRATSCTTWA